MDAEKIQNNIVYPKVKLKEVAKAFWRGIKPQKWNLFILISSVILANIVIIIVPVFYKQFFDVITLNYEKNTVANELIKIIVIIALMNGVFWIFYRIATFANNTYQPNVMANLKNQSYGYLMEHSYSFFAGSFVGSLVQKVNRFARAFERLSDDIIWNLLPLFVRTIAIFIIVFLFNKTIALVILFWIITFLFFNIIFSKWKIRYDLKAAETDSKATGYLADTITNQNTITIFGGLEYEKQGYKDITLEQVKNTKYAWNLDAITDSVQSFLAFGMEFLLLYFAIKYWQNGLLTVGVFVLLQAYLIDLIHHLWGFTRLIRDVYQSYADAKEMVEITLLPHEIKDTPMAKELLIKKGEIELKDLSFSFNKTRKILENINLKIKPGEKVALVGPSGAGKTTFVRLLLRFYSPVSGKILIDSQDISSVTQDSLRQSIAMVPQDPLLFHRTLYQNIKYAKPKASDKEIKRAAELAHCNEFINTLPHGYETYVGERGVKLSGGERQRVAIARAILKSAPILILDEATSSLDSNSEMLIQDALNNLMQGRTTIVIAHRLSTIQKMDRILVIDNGKIIEEGSHNELIKRKDSLYNKLWTMQVGGFLVADNIEKEKEELTLNNDDNEEQGDAKFVNFN